jgi:hypothetical protein
MIGLLPISAALWQNLGDPSCPHSSISIGSRKGQDDDLASFDHHENWGDSMGRLFAEGHGENHLANARLVRRGNVGEQPE